MMKLAIGVWDDNKYTPLFREELERYTSSCSLFARLRALAKKLIKVK